MSTLSFVDVALRVVITLWLVAISVRDARHGIILNRMTAPIFLGGGLLQIVYAAIVLRTTPLLPGESVWWVRPIFVLLSFAVCFGLWMLHFIGGGDAKFLMALLALFPHSEFLVLMAVVLLVVTSALFLIDVARTGLGAKLRSFRSRVLTGALLPTEAELSEHGKPLAWTYALPAAIYVWPYWSGLAPYAEHIRQFAAAHGF